MMLTPPTTSIFIVVHNRKTGRLTNDYEILLVVQRVIYITHKRKKLLPLVHIRIDPLRWKRTVNGLPSLLNSAK